MLRRKTWRMETNDVRMGNNRLGGCILKNGRQLLFFPRTRDGLHALQFQLHALHLWLRICFLDNMKMQRMLAIFNVELWNFRMGKQTNNVNFKDLETGVLEGQRRGDGGMISMYL